MAHFTPIRITTTTVFINTGLIIRMLTVLTAIAVRSFAILMTVCMAGSRKMWIFHKSDSFFGEAAMGTRSFGTPCVWVGFRV